MAQRNSNISKSSGPQRSALIHEPSCFTMVCESEEKTHPTILRLWHGGFLKLRFEPEHQTFDERAGVILPTEDELWGYEHIGQIAPGTVLVDGDSWFVNVGRKRLKGMALLNERESERTGTFTEPFKFRHITAKGTEDLSYAQQVIENMHGTASPPTVLAAAILRGTKPPLNHDLEYLSRLYQLSPAQLSNLLRLNDLSAEARAMVDSGEVAASAGFRELVKFERLKQASAVRAVWAAGIRKGPRFEEGLRRLREGLPIVDPDDASPLDSEEDETAEDGTSNDSGTGVASGDGKAKARPAAPADKPKLVRAPTKKRLAMWAEKLKEPAKAPDVEVPAKFASAYESAILAAEVRGARIMVARMLGKTPPGWAKIRAIVEAEEETPDTEE